MGLLDLVSETLKAGIDLGINAPIGLAKDVITGAPITEGKSHTVKALGDAIDHLEEGADKISK